MIYEFDTQDHNAALAALLVYGVWRSRDVKRFKITTDCWGVVERAVKASAKRARDLFDFIEKLKPHLSCSTLHPRWMRTDGQVLDVGFVDHKTGEILVRGGQDERRQFWVEEIENLEASGHRTALNILYTQTARVIALVRDRLERERPIEAQLKIEEEEE